MAESFAEIWNTGRYGSEYREGHRPRIVYNPTFVLHITSGPFEDLYLMAEEFMQGTFEKVSVNSGIVLPANKAGRPWSPDWLLGYLLKFSKVSVCPPSPAAPSFAPHSCTLCNLCFH